MPIHGLSPNVLKYGEDQKNLKLHVDIRNEPSLIIFKITS